MLKLAQQFANKPDFRAGVSAIQSSKDTAGAFATAFDQSIEAATAVGASRAQIIDAEGVLLARSDDASAHGNTLGGALIGGALEGHATQGFGVADSTSLAQVVAVPIPGAGGSMAGVLMALHKIDDSLAIQIGTQTGSELVFYHRSGPERAATDRGQLAEARWARRARAHDRRRDDERAGRRAARQTRARR